MVIFTEVAHFLFCKKRKEHIFTTINVGCGAKLELEVGTSVNAINPISIPLNLGMHQTQ